MLQAEYTLVRVEIERILKGSILEHNPKLLDVRDTIVFEWSSDGELVVVKVDFEG